MSKIAANNVECPHCGKGYNTSQSEFCPNCDKHIDEPFDEEIAEERECIGMAIAYNEHDLYLRTLPGISGVL
jgi:endogenous inhibitor of DNA gyrase (YacG/DUF329 family)